MCKRLICLVSLFSLLAAGTSLQAAGFSDNFDNAYDYVVDELGSYDGILDANHIVALNTSISKAGALYMETSGGIWDPGPGPMLYKLVTGDFVATVKVVDFAGTIDAPVFHNDAGLLARDPNEAAENWVSMNYFPTWTAFVARNTVAGARAELGQPAGRWTGVDTYAMAAQYPYIQLERKGSDFYFRMSADGKTFIPLTDPGYLGIYDGTQTPLVVSRPELPATLQLGLINATYDVTTGSVAFDDFTVVTPPKVIWVSFHGADAPASAGATGAGFTEAADKGYTDLLKANGYNVSRYITTGTPDVNVLNAADVVIIGRSVNSGNYQNASATTWNSQVTAPMIITSGYALRNSRMGFTTGATIPDTTGDIRLTATDPTHPIFAGVSLTDGTMDNVYAGIVTYPTNGTTLARGISVNTDPVNAEGMVLATVSADSSATGPAGGMIIAEWWAGATLTHAGGAGTDVLAGNRLVFLTGSREADGISSETAGMLDLAADGAQLFLNAVAYMINPPAKPGLVHSYTFDDGTANDSVGDAHGVLVGGATIENGALVTTAQDQWMEMPGSVIAMNTYKEVTIEAWYTPTANANTGWSMLAYFGDSVDSLGSNGFFMTSARGDDKSRAAISIGDIATPWASESGADGPEYDDGELHYMVATITATNISLYIDGALCATTPLSATNTISGISQNLAYLAKGGYGSDPEWIGAIHEFNIFNKAFTELEVAERFMMNLENFGL